MPCYITGSRQGDLELNLQEAQTEATEATRLLCSLCKEAEGKIVFPKNVQKWWEKHKKQDQKINVRRKKGAN